MRVLMLEHRIPQKAQPALAPQLLVHVSGVRVPSLSVCTQGSLPGWRTRSGIWSHQAPSRPVRVGYETFKRYGDYWNNGLAVVLRWCVERHGGASVIARRMAE